MKRRHRPPPSKPPRGNVEVTDWPNTRTRKAPCCGQPHELPADLEVSKPIAGDIAVCAHCGQGLLFNADMTLRVIGESDFDKLPTESKRALLQAMIDARTDPWLNDRAARLREAASGDRVPGPKSPIFITRGPGGKQ